ncbi:hypothetical protein [Paenibacillus turpanensis]|uniref:hypothetical protein n=1 Tax=Paenibacillus turpanensis TaxID=2689078 RepID=UPI00140AB0AE|nr:hypothetical protein [Paenibacillus turpanensis]
MKTYRNALINVISRIIYRLGRLIIVLIVSGFMLMSIQVIGDYNIYKTGEFKEEEIFITYYELTDGPRITNSSLPYRIISSDGDHYYLFKEDNLMKAEYIIKYMISTNGTKVILGISKKA